MKHVLLRVTLGCLALAMGLPARSAGVDLTVAAVEVTQAIQTSTNTIQLVAQRSTAVRATIGVTGGVGPVAGVTGTLHVFVDALEITPAGGVAPINAPVTAPLAPQRANENDTLNFELPAPTGITASDDVDFQVDITPVAGETDTTNNSGAANNLTVVETATPLLFFTRVDFTPSGLGVPALDLVQPGVGDMFVRGIFPVDDSDPNLYREGLFPRSASASTRTAITDSMDAIARGPSSCRSSNRAASSSSTMGWEPVSGYFSSAGLRAIPSTERMRSDRRERRLRQHPADPPPTQLRARAHPQFRLRLDPLRMRSAR
jgi:hypothetical protein